MPLRNFPAFSPTTRYAVTTAHRFIQYMHYLFGERASEIRLTFTEVFYGQTHEIFIVPRKRRQGYCRQRCEKSRDSHLQNEREVALPYKSIHNLITLASSLYIFSQRFNWSCMVIVGHKSLRIQDPYLRKVPHRLEDVYSRFCAKSIIIPKAIFPSI